MPQSITSDQIVQLQAKVAALVADKGAADGATAASNAAHAALQKAQADAGAADAAEAQADGKVGADMADLQAFVDNLAGTPSPVTPPATVPIPGAV